MQINFKTNRFAVIGLGDTGLSIIKYLQYKKAHIVKIFDTRDNPPNQEQIQDVLLICGKLKVDDFIDIDIIVISPGISIFDGALQQLKLMGKIIIGDIELFALAIKTWGSKVIGVTGSNGKTTVTTLVGYLANSMGINTLVAGNIGVPVLNSYIEKEQSKLYPKLIVLELSSFQLESTYSLELESATVLNISEDHLDRYRDLLEYAYYKANIFNHAKVQVLNSQDIFSLAMKRERLKTILFGNDKHCNYYYENDFIYLDDKQIVDCKKLQLVGKHNYVNAMSSLALLHGAGFEVKSSNLINSLYEFKGLEHRMQVIAKSNGVIFIEDSKGTNVGAVVAGVSGLTGKVHLILGGDGKGQDFSPLVNLVQDKCSSVAVIGQDKANILAVLKNTSILIKDFDTLEEATKFCYNNAVSGEYVVLSPACASWDMFKNYKHRAEVFVNYVNFLINKV